MAHATLVYGEWALMKFYVCLKVLCTIAKLFFSSFMIHLDFCVYAWLFTHTTQYRLYLLAKRKCCDIFQNTEIAKYFFLLRNIFYS